MKCRGIGDVLLPPTRREVALVGLVMAVERRAGEGLRVQGRRGSSFRWLPLRRFWLRR